MAFADLQSYAKALEREGELRRVTVEVDPELEITEIATRVVRDQGPALLFEQVKGSAFPLLINPMGTAKRIELALGRHPQAIGEELVGLVERINPPNLRTLWENRSTLLRLRSGARLKNVSRGACQEVVEAPDLLKLPALKCWPGDGGRFLTLAQVLTRSPETGKSNLGIYRMQIFEPDSTGMHWQIQKGGGFHHHEAEQRGEALEVAAVLGGSPAMLLSAVLPLPEGLEELVFTGVLGGSPTPMVAAKTLRGRVPANAEFVLEGRVQPGERTAEGPFGDHFGHYSNEAPFPVFNVNVATRRKEAIFPAAVVGKPPQEDRYMGEAVQEFINPFVRLIHPEVRDLWAYFEAGFHNLLVVSVKSRYTKEPMKTALGLFGNGQLALTKCIVLVGEHVNPRDFGAVLREMRMHFQPEADFLLLPKVPLDTLDFTSFKMHLGSKMAIDATPKGPRAEPPGEGLQSTVAAAVPPGLDWRLLEDTLLVVKVGEGAGLDTAARLAGAPPLSGLRMIAAVSDDVDLNDQTDLMWGIFTRFDPARDIVFPEMRMEGAAPLYRGPMGIDATWKRGYPDPLVMDPDIVERVNRRWEQYWK